MISRCGYFVRDGKVRRVIVQIEWNLGFTRDAKLAYINAIYSELKKVGFDRALDVTSANKTIQRGYRLSPLYMELAGKKLEDYYQDAVKSGMSGNQILLYANWLFGKGMTNDRIGMIKYFDVFVDVFAKPDVAEKSQSKACAVYKVLLLQDKLHLYDNPEAFFEWYLNNIPVFN